MHTEMFGTFGFQSRKSGTLNEMYGFKTKKEAIESSMGWYDGWNTIILEIVEGEFSGQIEFDLV